MKDWKVFKYPFDILTIQIIELPEGARPIHVGLDPNGRCCLWCIVHPDHRLVRRRLIVVGTGQRLGEAAEYSHVGSFLQTPFMWHVFLEDR